MKKMLAIALALMLLLASAALAETANVVTFSNVNVLVSSTDGNMAIDLSDLTATLAMGMANEQPIIQLDVTGGGEALLGAQIQFIDGRMVMAIDGVSRPIAADMGPTADQAQESFNELFANIDQVANLKLPAFTGVDIPKIDLMSIAEFLPMLGIQPVTEGQVTTFEIPAEMISQLMQIVLTQVPAETAAQLGDLDQLLANAQFAIKGKLADDGTTAEMMLDLYMAQGGATSDSPLGALYFASTQNADSLEILLYQDGQSVTLGQMDLSSDPAAATLDFGLDLMGQVTMNFSLYPENGAQVAALAFKAEDQELNASLTYGDEGDMEFSDFAFEIPNEQVSASIHTEETPDGNGGKVGVMGVNVEAQGQTVNVTADLEEGKADVQFKPITNAANAIDANNPSAADQQALNDELNSALAPIMNYLNNVNVQPAA